MTDVPVCVYYCWGAHDELLYVGLTKHLDIRKYQHARISRWWHQVLEVTSEEYPTRIEAGRIERRDITRFTPRFNIRRAAESWPELPRPRHRRPALKPDPGMIFIAGGHRVVATEPFDSPS